MAENLPAMSSTKQSVVYRTRPTTATSSSSQSPAAEHHPGSSNLDQVQGPQDQGLAASSTLSGKGKALQRHPISRPAPMDFYTDTSREGPMPQTTTPDPALEITYTPTTHRISKAKKGKKVHVCEYPGCGKVFTRAEHRKRHEANHRSEPMYKCQMEACPKTFQRLDLLTRHEERQHGIPQASPSIRDPRRRTSSPASSIATSSQANSPRAFPSGTRISPSGSAGQVTPAAVAMSIGSIITPTIGQQPFSQHELAWHDPYQPAFPMAPRGYPPELHFNLSTSDDSLFYSSDTGSCASPNSETPHSHNHSQPYLPQHVKPEIMSSTYPSDYQMHMTSPLTSIPSYNPWAILGEDIQPVDSIGIGFEGQYPNPVGISQSACITHEHPVDSLVDSTTPTGPTFMGRNGGSRLRANSSIEAGLVASKNGLVKLDDETLRHYLDCYWEFCVARFPVLHRPTTLYTEPGSILNTTLLAIGAQHSNRPHAKFHSMSWFKDASEFCATLEPESFTSNSPLHDLQAIILLEVLGLFRSPYSGVYKSAHFEAMYTSLLNDRERFKPDPEGYVQCLSKDANPCHLQTAYSHWVQFETRRRILVTAFALDTHRSVLFQRPPCHTFISGEVDMPTLSSSELWECADPGAWLVLLSKSRPEESVCPFTQHYLHARHLISPTNEVSAQYQDSTFHALLLATNTPITALLTVAAESWLFARKVEHPTKWTAAKVKLGAWAQSEQASKAVWHAGHVLRTHLGPGNMDSTVGLHTSWCLYLAALVCWAYGFSVQAQAQQLDLPSERYLNALKVPTWKEVEGLRAKGATKSLLVDVKARLGGKWNGALIAEGERVLQRLIEGRGRFYWF